MLKVIIHDYAGHPNPFKLAEELSKKIEVHYLYFINDAGPKGNFFNIKKNLRFISNEEICKSEDIDAIYISTLNNTHFDLIKQCSLNNKKILKNSV